MSEAGAPPYPGSLDSVCREVAGEQEEVEALAIVDRATGQILGQYRTARFPVDLADHARAAVELLEGSSARALYALGPVAPNQAGEAAPFQELLVRGDRHAFFVRPAADGRALFLLATRATTSPAWGWTLLRSAQRKLEPRV